MTDSDRLVEIEARLRAQIAQARMPFNDGTSAGTLILSVDVADELLAALHAAQTDTKRLEREAFIEGVEWLVRFVGIGMPATALNRHTAKQYPTASRPIPPQEPPAKPLFPDEPVYCTSCLIYSPLPGSALCSACHRALQERT